MNLTYLRLVAFDRAIGVAFMGRLWQSLAGIVTLFFVVRYFSPALQGYFQTFLSLIALQAFVELGLLGVIVVVVSHEWVGLELRRNGQVSGPEESLRRVASAVRFVAAWFSLASVVLLFAGGAAGTIILQQHGETDLWVGPWVATISLAAALLFLQSMVAVLEGANKVFEVALYRFASAALSSIVLWTCAALGFGLWSLVAQLATGVICTIAFLGGFYWPLFLQLLRLRGPSSFNWRVDVWPMQWQLALQGIAGYFSASLLVPVMFSYYGPVEAGRMGLSLQVVLAMSALATSWLVVGLPRLGTAFASGDYSRFERHWMQTSGASLIVVALAGVSVVIVISAAAEQHIAVADRFLAPLPFALLILWAIVLQVVQCCALYWRAQRVELLRFWGILPGTATGLAVWLFGKNFGATGATAGAFGAAVLVTLPLIGYLFAISRRKVKLLRLGLTNTEVSSQQVAMDPLGPLA